MKYGGQSQRGLSLLLFLIVVVGFFSTFALSALNNANGRAAQERKTELALQQAKEALIGDAVTATIPGRLPCPERLSIGSPIEGQAQGTCTTPATRIGRFPWRSLNLDRMTDSAGEPLWYVISPGFSAKPINSNTVGQLQLNGSPNAAVAIIFAPGLPLPGQARSQASPTNRPQEADYLDLGNAGGTAFVSMGPAASFNDRVVVITQSDLFKAVNKRVLSELRGLDDQAPNLPIRGLRSYYKTYAQFPWADSNSDGLADLNAPTGKLPYDDLALDPWLVLNGWPTLANYTRLTVNTAQISIGSSILKVVPCPALPCP